MATMKIYKVNQLPAVLEANASYYVKDGDGFIQYIIDSAGAIASKAKADPTKIAFNRYDLPYTDAANGVMNLSVNQVFKIDATTTGAAVALSFTNPPVGKSMVVVVQVNGSTRSVTLPVGTTVMDTVDNTLGVVMTVMTFFYDGAKFYLMNSSKIDA